MTLRILMVLCLIVLVGCGSSNDEWYGNPACKEYLNNNQLALLNITVHRPLIISQSHADAVFRNAGESYYRQRVGIIVESPDDNSGGRGKVPVRGYLENRYMCGKEKDKPCILLAEVEKPNEMIDFISKDVCTGAHGLEYRDMVNYYLYLYISPYDSYSTKLVFDIPVKGQYSIPISVNQSNKSLNISDQQTPDTIEGSL